MREKEQTEINRTKPQTDKMNSAMRPEVVDVTHQKRVKKL